MAILKRINKYQGLKDIDVLVEESGITSQYFNIYEVPDALPQGRSSFLLAGSPFLKNNVELREGEKFINIKPTNKNFDVKFTLKYENCPLIKTQTNKINFKNNNLDNVINARTFCLYEDIEEIKSLGLAKGGSLKNAIVVKGDKILNEEGLRCDMEFVNHKILDLVGDFMLSGVRVIGAVECIHGGHALTNQFLKKIFSNKNNYSIIESESSSENIRKILPINKRLAVNA